MPATLIRCSLARPTAGAAGAPLPLPAIPSKRAFAAGVAAAFMLALSPPLPAAALGLESIATPLDSLPTPVTGAGGVGAGRQKAAIAAAEEAFAQSDLLRVMKDRTAANAAKNKKAIADKYCYRQAELGIGDCGGLRYIAGATKSGKQKTPKALLKLLGKSEEESAAIQAVQAAQSAAAAAAKAASSAAE